MSYKIPTLYFYSFRRMLEQKGTSASNGNPYAMPTMATPSLREKELSTQLVAGANGDASSATSSHAAVAGGNGLQLRTASIASVSASHGSGSGTSDTHIVEMLEEQVWSHCCYVHDY